MEEVCWGKKKQLSTLVEMDEDYMQSKRTTKKGRLCDRQPGFWIIYLLLMTLIRIFFTELTS